MTDDQSTSGAEEPQEWFTLTDTAQLRLLTNDLRMRILQAMAEEEMTPKQVAERLGEPPTKLYRHVEMLADAGLITPTREVRKRGTMQKFYRAVARRFRVDQRAFAAESDTEGGKFELVFELLNTIGSELAAASAQTETPYIAAAHALAHLTPDQAERLSEALISQLTQIAEEHDNGDNTNDAQPYRISLVIHPATSD